MTLLKVEKVSRRFGSLVAVDDVSMVVEPGELRAIIGPNGAGKTTLFNLISGFLAPTSGRVLLRNEDVTCLPPAHRVWRGMARTFQVTEIFPELPVGENLRIAVEVASEYRLRAWLSLAADAKVRAQVDHLLEKGGLAGKGAARGRGKSWRSAGPRDHDGSGAAASASVAGRTDRRDGRSGDL
jgi:branched-chain amino acid transport system ATP-binding protein